MGKQICYTDEDMYELCRDNIRNYIEAQLASGLVIGKDFFAVDIAQNDNSDYCTCRECMKVFSVEGSNSGAVVRFANRLSEELNEDYIIPAAFDPRVGPAVAKAVAEAARKSGVARI